MGFAMGNVDVQIELPTKLIDEMKKYSVNWNEFVIKCVMDKIQAQDPPLMR